MSDNPFGMKFVMSDRRKMVCLDAIIDRPLPDYTIHGRTRCFGCDRWCHLGSGTFEIVASGEATPYCVKCAAEVAAPSGLIKSVKDKKDHR